ncbi:MAG: hypothetical protein H6742_18065 [Alphaproteobacteria bacterium]|nr:hypothetical protein [Alphaproteobacteria bacterium]
MTPPGPGATTPGKAATAVLALALTAWVCALFAAPFLTVLPRLTVDGWWQWPLLRVALVLASAVGVGLATGLFSPRAKARAAAVATVLCGGLSLGLSINPVLDLVRGPLDAVGTVQDSAAWTQRFRGRPSGTATTTDHGRLEFRAADGDLTVIEPLGFQVSHMEAALQDCPRLDGPVRLVALRHLDIVVAVECVDRPPGR